MGAVMLRLHAARHAQAAVTGLCYGRSDVPTELGAEEAATRILGQLDSQEPLAAVWCSPARRCHEPAATLATRLELPLRVCADLSEIDFGEWEGRSWDALEREDGARLARWMADWQREAPPGGEALADLEGRVRGWVRREAPSGLLVGHAGVLRALDVVVRGIGWEQAMAAAVEPLELRCYELGAAPA